jgi:hypothetical protein
VRAVDEALSVVLRPTKPRRFVFSLARPGSMLPMVGWQTIRMATCRQRDRVQYALNTEQGVEPTPARIARAAPSPSPGPAVII